MVVVGLAKMISYASPYHNNLLIIRIRRRTETAMYLESPILHSPCRRVDSPELRSRKPNIPNTGSLSLPPWGRRQRGLAHLALKTAVGDECSSGRVALTCCTQQGLGVGVARADRTCAVELALHVLDLSGITVSGHSWVLPFSSRK